MLSLTAPGTHTELLLSACTSALYYVLKTHANRISAQKIEQLTKSVGLCDIDFITKPSEREIALKMKRGDTVLVVHTEPAHYSGAVCLCEVVDSVPGKLIIRFVRYLRRIISVREIKENSAIYELKSCIVGIGEEEFFRLLELENALEP